jgi:hypothetical protein
LHGTPSAFSHGCSAFADRTGRISSTLGCRFDSFAHGLRAFADSFAGGRGGSRGTFRHGLRAFADGMTGRLGRIPSAFGHSLGTLGGGGNGIAGFLDGGLRVFLGLVTGRQTESGRCHNEEIRFHSSAKVKNAVGRGNHIFAKMAEEPLNTDMPHPVTLTGTAHAGFLPNS